MKQNVKNDTFVYDDFLVGLAENRLTDKRYYEKVCKFKENDYGFLGNGKQNTETQAIKIYDTRCTG